MTTTETNDMPFSVWLATEGGRRCPQCGKFANRSEVGNLSYFFRTETGTGHVSMYGHLPGYGCNKGREPKP